MPEECPNMENGHCTHHEAEVERRRISQRDIDTLTRHVGELLTFKNRMMGGALVGGIIITGCYLYTYVHTQRSDTEHMVLRQQIEKLEDEVGRVEIDIALANERYSNILAAQNDTKAEVRSVKSEIRELVNALREEGRVTRVHLEDDD